jgi:Xaa-Pro aminopeptidase
MKTDLDRLMAERGLDAFVVLGRVHNNPIMHYMVNGAKMTVAEVVKRRGEPAVLIHGSMERDEAAKSGLVTRSREHYDLIGLMQQEGDRFKAIVRYYAKVLVDLVGLRGNVGVYGSADLGQTLALLAELRQVLPGIEFVGEADLSIFDVAMMTKDADEVARIRRMGQVTAEVVGETVDFLRGHQVHESKLVKRDGEALTIGDVKRAIRRMIMERGVEDAEEVIFAIGRDAGVPHSHGEEGDPLVLGKTIVYDIFPQESGGGYFFDMTRTFCLGYVEPEAEAVYDDVRGCLETVIAAMQPDGLARDYQNLACDYFEQRGHPTIRSDRNTLEGYVHTLGHGIGLQLHSRPSISHIGNNDDRLVRGSVFTVEPGLYYPERGFGVRIEDVLHVDENGQFHNLTNYPRDLVIDLR